MVASIQGLGSASGAGNQVGVNSITDDQKNKIQTILSQYDPKNITAVDAKKIFEAFRNADIRPARGLKETIQAAGFNVDDLRTKARLGGALSPQQMSSVKASTSSASFQMLMDSLSKSQGLGSAGGIGSSSVQSLLDLFGQSGATSGAGGLGSSSSAQSLLDLFGQSEAASGVSGLGSSSSAQSLLGLFGQSGATGSAGAAGSSSSSQFFMEMLSQFNDPNVSSSDKAGLAKIFQNQSMLTASSGSALDVSS